MERMAVNPSSWSVKLGFDQAELVEGHRRELICSAQDAVDANGNAQHPGDMAAQLGLALDNLDEVPAGADMTLANMVRLNFYTTDSPPARSPLASATCSAGRSTGERLSGGASLVWSRTRRTRSGSVDGR